jgi:hypothetical protein
MPKPTGFLLYSGPSMLDGSPIVAIATGIGRPSQNRKTGAMVQVWIMPRDVAPIESLKSGADAAVCGDCPLRGILGKKRACYVDVAKAPGAVFSAYQNGSYHEWDGSEFTRPVRLGAWGDPAALPLEVLERIVAAAPKGHTGYSHQWRRFPALQSIVMASADSDSDRADAHAAGWRTFRVLPKGASVDERDPSEIVCPASPEGGDRAACATCRLCDGARSNDRRKSIAILAHGSGAAFAGA